MTLRFILQGLAILIFFSSCAKQTFLFPGNTGGYESVYKPEQIATSTDHDLNRHMEESFSASICPKNNLATEESFTKPLVETAYIPVSTNYNETNLSLRSTGNAFGGNANKLLKKPFHASVSKKANTGENPISKERTGYLFSILSFASGVAGVVLTLSFSQAFFLFFGIPAIMFGLISLSKKEKLRGLAIAGLILGTWQALLIFLIIYYGIYTGH